MVKATTKRKPAKKSMAKKHSAKKIARKASRNKELFLQKGP